MTTPAKVFLSAVLLLAPFACVLAQTGAQGNEAIAPQDAHAVNATDLLGAAAKVFFKGLTDQINSHNFTSEFGGASGASIVPFAMTRLAGNWLNSTYACMLDYYARANSMDANQSVSELISAMATNAVEDIVQPGADLCLSS